MLTLSAAASLLMVAATATLAAGQPVGPAKPATSPSHPQHWSKWRPDQLDGLGAAKSGRELPIDAGLLEQNKRLQQLVTGQRFEEALELAGPLIGSTRAQLGEAGAERAAERQLLTRLLFNEIMVEMKALHMLKRPFHVLVEGLRLRTLCNKYAPLGCTERQLNLLEATMSYVKGLVKKSPRQELLGREACEPANADKTRRRLFLLLHPDKNRDLDAPSTRELGEIFELARRVCERPK